MLLVDIYKASRAIGFYPDSHPLREEILGAVYESLKEHVKEKELVLVISRAGFAVKDELQKIETNQMITALAGEMFVRRIQHLAFLPDLTLADMRNFLQLLSLDPNKLLVSGGMPQLMLAQGIRTIWANEMDLSAIWEKRQALEEKKLSTLAAADDDESWK